MKKKISLASSNSGSATITVIVTMLLVVALGSALLFGAYTSYRIALTQRQDRQTLYSAENAMDDIRSGIQEAVSEALETAYTETLTGYAKNEVSDPQRTFSERINAALDSEAFYDKSLSGYSASALQSFISDSGAEYNVGAGAAGEESGSVTTETDDTGAITELCFEDVSLVWLEDGYESRLSADIVISIPGFSGELGDYAIVAGEGISIGSANGTREMNATIEGAVYSGSRTVAGAIVGGDIEVGRGCSLQIDGTCYVADDLVLSGEGAAVTLSGEYYGCGGSTTNPNESSAILVNGKDASLDLSGLGRLYLAGFSFIDARDSMETLAGLGNSKVLMGQSMAFKANQLAYLAPVECVENYASNPFEMRTIVNPISGETEYVIPTVNNEVVLWDNKKLSDYGGTVSLYRNMGLGTLRVGYVFMRFSDKDKANEYFRMYFEKYPDRISQYLNFYLELKSSGSEVVTEGNTFNYTEAEGLELLPATGGAQVTGQRFSDFVKTGSFSGLVDDEALVFEQGGVSVLVKNGDYEYKATDEYSLVISSGNVTVTGTKTGCVLAAGRVTLCKDDATNTSLTAAALPKGVLSARETAYSGTSYQLSDFLRESYGSSGAQTGNAWRSDKIVFYRNWQKN